MAVYFATINPGDTILSLSLDQGGHLSHGSPVNFSGKLYNIVPYTVSKETERIDYDALERQALEVKPKILLTGASAYPRALDFKRIREICDKVGCIMMVDMAHIAGLVAGGARGARSRRRAWKGTPLRPRPRMPARRRPRQGRGRWRRCAGASR